MAQDVPPGVSDRRGYPFCELDGVLGTPRELVLGIADVDTGRRREAPTEPVCTVDSLQLPDHHRMAIDYSSLMQSGREVDLRGSAATSPQPPLFYCPTVLLIVTQTDDAVFRAGARCRPVCRRQKRGYGLDDCIGAPWRRVLPSTVISRASGGMLRLHDVAASADAARVVE